MARESLGDTIAALATPPGKGGVGIVRISGSIVGDIARQFLGKVPAPRQATVQKFATPAGEIIDVGLALFFPGPHSFTGEDVLELHCHGSPVVLDMLLTQIIHFGARLARPGEFSQRAFLNGKIDLAQAEAIADLIDASTKQAALSASRSLQGVFSQRIQQLATQLMELRIYVEAAIDFPEEEIDFLSENNLTGKIQACLQELHLLSQSAKQGQLLREGMMVVIIGQPNAGKSSLMNALTQMETAIVTPIPGTTRDLIKETIHIDGLPVHLIDTAGIRLEADVVEQEGIRRAKAQLKLADRILLMRDVTCQELGEIETAILAEYGEKTTQIMNKIDLQGMPAKQQQGQIFLSAKTGEGLDLLFQHLKECMGYQEENAGQFIARRRHLEALQKTQHCCEQALRQLTEFRAGELVAHELWQAQEALGGIVGRITSDELLGHIFASFCIGK